MKINREQQSSINGQSKQVNKSDKISRCKEWKRKKKFLSHRIRLYHIKQHKYQKIFHPWKLVTWLKLYGKIPCSKLSLSRYRQTLQDNQDNTFESSRRKNFEEPISAHKNRERKRDNRRRRWYHQIISN